MYVRVDAHVAHDAVADGALLGVGQRRRRGVPQVRQALRAGRGPVAGEQQGGGEGAEFHSVETAMASCYYDGRTRGEFGEM